MNKTYYKTIHQIITTGHWITDHLNRELKKIGMTEPQYNVIRTLFEANGQPCSVKHIQNCMVQKSSNVTRIIDRLLAKGFVERHECPSNRRKMDITLTKDGLEMLRKMDMEVHSFHQSMIHNLEISELSQLNTLIKKLKKINNA